MVRRVRTCVLCAAAFLVAAAEGQSYHAFQWKFGNDYIEQSFDECQTLSVVVEPLANSSALGVAPYYLVAFEVGGVPTTSLIGSDPSNLSWTANHRAGAELMLTVMDSNRSTGGMSVNPYTMNPVATNSNVSCLSSVPSSSASLTSNVTGTALLRTCDPWGLTVTGGKKPYQIVLSALNSTVITNVTMGDDDDVFTYIDRADPNGSILASVVDATGQWGTSSNLVKTAGSTDYDCVGLVSSSQTSAQIAQEAADRAQAAHDADARRRTRLIAGLVVGLGVPLILGLCAAAWLWRRRHRPQTELGLWDSQDVTPRPLDPPAHSHEMREVDAAELKHAEYARYSPTGTPLMSVEPIPPVYFDREVAAARSRGEATAGSSAGSSGGAGSPTPEGNASARYRKVLEASRGHPYSTTGGSVPSSAQGSMQSLHPANTRPLRPMAMGASQLVDTSLDSELEPDIIIQHRDGGVVQELPPPYADRSAQIALGSPISSPSSNLNVSLSSEGHTAHSS